MIDWMAFDNKMPQRNSRAAKVAKYGFCEGDYCPNFDIRKDGTATRTHVLFYDRNCTGMAYTQKADCPNRILTGMTCKDEFELYQSKELFLLKKKHPGKFSDGAYFELDHQGKPTSLFPDA